MWKLLELNNKPYYSGFAKAPSHILPFNLTTGKTGHAMITAYASGNPESVLSLLSGASLLQSVSFPIQGMTGVPSFQMFQYDFIGSPNTTYSNFSISVENHYSEPDRYLGWSYYPF